VVKVFTGLVADLGTVTAVDASHDGVRLAVDTSLELSEGDSVSVNGVCLTATRVGDGGFRADVMNETLRRSSLAQLETGSRVNLELPLRAADRLGGHFVQGHVDGVGTVRALREDGFARVVEIGAPRELLRYVVEKGSITVDGISLTVVGVTDDAFTVSLIPETLERTNLGQAAPGQPVNLEVDVLAKYVEKLIAVPR
jgi:riboflavin synthase